MVALWNQKLQNSDRTFSYLCRTLTQSTLSELLSAFIEGVYATSTIEWIAVTTGVLSVWFSMKENILVYPFGIVSVLIYVYLAFQYKLYADMGVNGYYFVMSVYGWMYWKNTDGVRDQIPVTVNNAREWLTTVTLLVGSFGILVFVLMNFTDSDVPFGMLPPPALQSLECG